MPQKILSVSTSDSLDRNDTKVIKEKTNKLFLQPSIRCRALTEADRITTERAWHGCADWLQSTHQDGDAVVHYWWWKHETVMESPIPSYSGK